MISIPRLTSRWSVIFFLLPSINTYFLKIGYIKPIVVVWQSIIILISMNIFIKYTNKFNIMLAIFAFINIFSSLINNNLTLGIIYSSFTTLSICILISYSMKKNCLELITGMYYLYGTIIVLNFLSMIIFPKGISQENSNYPIYFLGGKNALQMIILPSIFIIYLYSYKVYNRLKFIPFFVILIGIVSMYISESGTGITLAIITMCYLFAYKKINLKAKSYLFISISIFITIVIFRLHEVLFGNFIVNVLGKDITLTGRTYIWDLILKNIKEFWLIGLGRGNTFIFDNFYLGVNETHNGFLEILLYSGILGLIVFITILLVIMNRLDSYYSVYSKILSFGIFSYMIVGLSESVFYKIELWILFIMSYNVPYILEKIKISEREKI